MKRLDEYYSAKAAQEDISYIVDKITKLGYDNLFEHHLRRCNGKPPITTDKNEKLTITLERMNYAFEMCLSDRKDWYKYQYNGKYKDPEFGFQF